MSALPENNLTQNIGFGVDATHTKMGVPPSCVLESVPQDLKFPLVHPEQVRRGRVADTVIERHVFGQHRSA